MKYRLLILPLLCLFCACAKKKDRNKVPSIMLKGISTNEIKTGSSEFVHVFFSFADGDGDLGVKPSSGDFDIYTIDNRDTAKVVISSLLNCLTCARTMSRLPATVP